MQSLRKAHVSKLNTTHVLLTAQQVGRGLCSERSLKDLGCRTLHLDMCFLHHHRKEGKAANSAFALNTIAQM